MASIVALHLYWKTHVRQVSWQAWFQYVPVIVPSLKLWHATYGGQVLAFQGYVMEKWITRSTCVFADRDIQQLLSEFATSTKSHLSGTEELEWDVLRLMSQFLSPKNWIYQCRCFKLSKPQTISRCCIPNCLWNIKYIYTHMITYELYKDGIHQYTSPNQHSHYQPQPRHPGEWFPIHRHLPAGLVVVVTLE